MKESQVFYVPPIPEVSVSPLYFNHCGRCMGIFHCEFNLHFPNGCWCWTSFHVLICHLYVVFCEVFLPAFASFLIGLFLTVEFWELFIYSWELSFTGYVVCTYFLPVCSLFFYSLYQVFSRAEVFSLDKNNFLYLITRYLRKNVSKIKLFLRIPRSLSPQFSSVQSLSRVWLFATPWIAARQASLSITNSQSLLKLMSIESVMPSSHLILCHPLLLPPIPPSLRVFSNESALPVRLPKDWSLSFSTLS